MNFLISYLNENGIAIQALITFVLVLLTTFSIIFTLTRDTRRQKRNNTISILEKWADPFYAERIHFITSDLHEKEKRYLRTEDINERKKMDKELNLELKTLTSFKIFGQDKLGWITQRIVELLNNELLDDSEWINRVDREAEEKAEENGFEFGYPDLESLANKIRRK